MKRIGLIVEGIGEVPAFKTLIPKLSTPCQILHQPVRADLQPKAAAKQVAASAKAAIQYLCKRNVDLIVVLIDREDRPSASKFATELKQAFSSRYAGIAFEVVVKDSCIENWLLADPEALRAQPRRFKLTDAVINRVVPNKADSVDAQNLLNSIAVKFEYDKGADPTRIASLQKPHSIAANSRSFRRFLRVLEDPKYVGQSKQPA